MSLLVEGQATAEETDVRVPGGLHLGELGLAAFAELRERGELSAAARRARPSS